MILNNLIPYPSMEGVGWSGGQYTSEKYYTGSKSIKLSGTSSTVEVLTNTTNSIYLIKNHIYYARVYGYQLSKTSGATVGFYWPIAEPSFNDNIEIKDPKIWNIYSAVNNRSSFSTGNYQFRIDFNNKNKAGNLYVDGCMLIDLTDSFGSGNEPTKNWLDENLPYFEGSKNFNFFIKTVPQIIYANFSPNPSNINTKTTLSVNINEEKIIAAPWFFYSNDIYCGEV